MSTKNRLVKVEVRRPQNPEVEPVFPYFAYYENLLVLVTGPGDTSDYRSGIMVTANSFWKAFEYFSDMWTFKYLKPVEVSELNFVLEE